MMTPDYDPVATAQQQSNRRLETDRRKFTLQTLVRGVTNAQRRQLRRVNDQNQGGYIDRHDPRVLLSTLGILLLSLTDAVLTLTLLQHGAVELNSFMAVLIETDVQLFVAGKMAITAVCLTFLLIHAKFRIFRVVRISMLLYAFLSIYGLLIAYELVLLSMAPS
jgi:hypothetical protein